MDNMDNKDNIDNKNRDIPLLQLCIHDRETVKGGHIPGTEEQLSGVVSYIKKSEIKAGKQKYSTVLDL